VIVQAHELIHGEAVWRRKGEAVVWVVYQR